MHSSFSLNHKSKRRPVRSCDTCRSRKGDATTMPDNQCSSCLAFGESCTYSQLPGKRGPKNKLVEELKDKISVLENKLRTLSVCALCSQPLQSTFDSESPPSPEVPVKTERAATFIKDPHEGDEDISEELTDRFRQWQISTLIKFTPRLFGTASNISLVQSAFAMKEKYLGRPLIANSRLKRPLYWGQFPWEKDLYAKQPPYIFPVADLLNHLLDLYFDNIHPTFPILHRHSFRQDVAEGLHETDTSFGAVLLAVLGPSSPGKFPPFVVSAVDVPQYSDESRVMVDGNPLSAGWIFVSQLRIFPNLAEPTVHHAQFYCLMTLFSLGKSTPHITWAYLGLAVRFVQYHGRYLRIRTGPKFQDELWNRAFWSIFILDGLLSSLLGRSPSINPEEFDVDPPLEVDDEYWDHGFIQPLGKPSSISFFVHLTRLFQILCKTLSHLYASQLFKARMGLTVEREKEIVAELDSMMNAFLGSLPAHLRWDSVNRNGVFFEQSAVLRATFHWLQITVHRLYMHNQTPLAGPSLSICLTAARSALNVMDIWTSASPRITFSFLVQNPTFISAVILVMNIFAVKRAGLDVDKDLAQVQTALRVAKICEARWQSSGRQWELLQELQTLEGSRDQDAPPASLEGQSRPGELLPGMSIEQLLSETGGSMNGWDSELLSMWLPAPSESLMNVDQWDFLVEALAGP
ncbi:fungal-specific transcription factor domain-containing protein [Roridomyces roridus]|uniref:Fungal-specific transcription factor domain-containing protein n=1 Tax=Roridomyces roridus TaxID=1738132 RepID=A0AAD7CIF8_9AGAR|nr:fungal-specific transcription factor domain-containing protein [Roridomyces roridus]